MSNHRLLRSRCAAIRLRSFFLCAALLAAAGQPPRLLAGARHPYVGAPKAIAYDEGRDLVIRQESVFTTGRRFPGHAVSYYGNRLNKYRYLGPAGRGGIYDAIDAMRRQRSLDPAQYRYHW